MEDREWTNSSSSADEVNAEKAAPAIGVSAATLKRWARLNLVPCRRYSRKIIRFNIAELKASKHVQATPPTVVELPPVRPRLVHSKA